MKNKKYMILFMAATLVIIFSLSYYLTDRYISSKKIKGNAVTASETYKARNINDSTKIYLFSGENKEKELTIAELKKELNIEGDLTQGELAKLLKNKGYILEVESNGEMKYRKDISNSIKPNKYYIGEKDGYLAIYKTNNDGTLIIENNGDVYSSSKKVNTLRESDRNKIKDFEFQFDTKEDAEESLSEFLS